MILLNLQLFGGRGSSSRGATGSNFTVLNNANQVTQNNQSSITNQAPDASNTPVSPGGASALAQMDDDTRANLILQSKNVDMPNHLSDVTDATQKFVYTAGINGKPQVLDTAAFNQYLIDNNISRRQILSRSVSDVTYSVNGTNYKLSGAQIHQMTRDSALNYIGGKHGGQVYGAGTYFDMNGGQSTGYGGRHSVTMHGVLSPNARVIDLGSLKAQAATWSRKNPKSAAAIGGFSSKTASIYALSMGFNVITDSKTNPSYHNIIDRTALVLDSANY